MTFLTARVLISCFLAGMPMQSHAAAKMSNSLPDLFVLVCAPPVSAKDSRGIARNGFEIDVNLRTNRFKSSFESVERPIKSVDANMIELRDEHIAKYVDNNPAHFVVRFDIRRGILTYDTASYARVPNELFFSTFCKIVKHAQD